MTNFKDTKYVHKNLSCYVHISIAHKKKTQERSRKNPFLCNFFTSILLYVNTNINQTGIYGQTPLRTNARTGHGGKSKNMCLGLSTI
jgi:hypothetical protein